MLVASLEDRVPVVIASTLVDLLTTTTTTTYHHHHHHPPPPPLPPPPLLSAFRCYADLPATCQDKATCATPHNTRRSDRSIAVLGQSFAVLGVQDGDLLQR
jgi:hypothetical protein